MFSRLSYTFREMWASLRRNLTLTVAAIITASVSLLLFGLTLLIQRGFDNQLSQWSGGVELIVYLRNDASDLQIQQVREALESQPTVIDTTRLQYLDLDASLAEAQRLFAGDPDTLQLLTRENMPTQFKVVPTDEASTELLTQLSAGFRGLPGVQSVVFPGKEIDVLTTLRGFIGVRLFLITAFLLVSAVLLIWNTIRTAMFARRREIEVMKLVGATDWFIRVPFMLEGLIHGFIGGLAACGGLWVINNRWAAGVKDFPPNSGFAALVVESGFVFQSMGILLVIGMVAGAIGSGIAASRFLDV